MEENMNVENEETIDEYCPAEVEESGGPSKGFIGLVVGAAAAVTVGVIAWRKHRKKKKADAEVVDVDYEEDDEEFFDDEEEETEK